MKEHLPDFWEPKCERHTFYQTGSSYDSKTFLQTDFVKACVNMGTRNIRQLIESFDKTDAGKDVFADLTVAQDVGEYYVSGCYDGKRHEDIVLRKQDGSMWQFGLLPGLPYVLPTKGWNNYLIDCAKEAIQAGAKGITLQEIGIFGDSGYEKAFCDEWKRFYGTPCPKALWSDPKLYFMGQHLRNYLGNRQVKQIFGSIKSKHPNIECVVANHTPPAYYSFSNSSGNHDLAAMDEVDGIEGQTWSNTIEISFTYNGRHISRPFVTGFFEYSYWANLGRQFPSKKIFFITDPKGDGYNKKTLEKCRDLYKHQVVAQLAFSNVYRYNSCVWPDRSYSFGYNGNPISTEEYRTIINNIISLQNQMYKYQAPISTNNQGVRVGVLLLDTACYQAGGPGSGVSSDDLFGMFAGLMYNGLMVEAIPFGEKESERNILEEYDVLIVSYDTMKPLTPLCNEMLQEYIEKGGIVLYIGGQGEYEDLDYMWWKKGGFTSPQDELIKRLGIEVFGRCTNLKGPLKSVYDLQLSEGLGDNRVDISCMIGYLSVNKAIPLYMVDDKIISFETEVDKGSFIYLGVTPKVFCEVSMGEALFKFIQAIVKRKLSVDIEFKNHISYCRGPVYGFNALGTNDSTKKGAFINLFDEKLSIVEDVKVNAGESALLLDIKEKLASSKPVVLFAQGANPTIIEHDNITRVVTSGPSCTNGIIRIYIPKRYTVKSITAEDAIKNDALIRKEYDGVSRTLLIAYANNVNKVIVDVEYS